MTDSRGTVGCGAGWLGDRWLRVIAVPLILISIASCRLVETSDPAPPEPAAAVGPAIEAGDPDPAENREVARLLREGEELLSAGRAADARALALEIEDRYPTAEGSGLAFWLRARASAELDDWAEADDAVERYVSLVSAGGPFHAAATLLRARVRWEGDLGGGIEALFEVPEEAGEDVLAEAEQLAADWAADFATPTLQALVREAPSHPRVLPPFLVELAMRRDLAGNRAEAEELAERAVALSPGPETAERARAIAEGRVEDLGVAAVIGAILPSEGPPSLVRLAEEIAEGMQTAIAVAERDTRFPVRLVRVDDGTGSQADLVRAVQELERSGVAATVGPLMDPLFGAAAQARSAGLPMLSPTARTVPEALGVFSLTAPDPEAGRALARLVLDTGVNEVTLLHSNSTDATMEAGWFRERFEEGGGAILQTFDYSQGATNFEWPLAAIAEAAGVVPDTVEAGADEDVEPEPEVETEPPEPVNLVIIAPGEELQLLAPQLFFYRIHEIEELTIFGGEAWTSDAVLQSIPARHTEGVLSVTTRSQDGGYGPAWDEFVEAYESLFQRTLRSPTPALGYDAAQLLIHAARQGGGDAGGALEALSEIRDFPGATGLLSVVDGRIQRAYTAVRIEGRRLVPLFP